MTNIKRLKSNPEYNINLVEISELLLTNKKSKYVDLYLRLFKGVSEDYSQNFDENEYSKLVGEKYGKTIPLIISPVLFNDRYIRLIKVINEFAEYNEKGIIENNDITKFDTIQDVEREISNSFVRKNKASLKKQVKELYRDDDWTLVQPITFLSSSLYGSGTKWCTTMKTDTSYFYRYIKDGMLVYCVGKKSKYAIYKENYDRITVWNEEDVRIDFLETDMPSYLIDIIRNLYKNEFKYNIDLQDNSVEDPDYIKYEKDLQSKKGCEPTPERVYVVPARPQEMTVEFTVTETSEDDTDIEEESE